MALLIVFSQLPLALLPAFQTATCWSCDLVLYRLRLEWMWQLAEKDVTNFISLSRNYPVILFKYATFNHLFWSCCICFHWPNLRKSFLNLIIQIDFMLILTHALHSPLLLTCYIYFTFVCRLFPSFIYK